MSSLVVVLCAVVGAMLGPAAAGASRVLHQRPPRLDELTGGYRRGDTRTIVCTVGTAALFAAAAALYGWSWWLVPVLFLIVVLLVVAAVDFEHYLIPNRIVFPSLGAAAVLVAVAAVGAHRPGSLGTASVGAVAFWLVLFVLHLVNPAGMGFGDVKFSLLLGLYLGWAAGTYPGALYLVLLALLVASLSGSVVGVVLLIRRGRGAHYPFGPWLGLGTLVVLAGAELLRS